MLSKSFEFLDERRALDVEQFSGAIAIASGSIQASLNEIALDCRKIRWQIETVIWKFYERSLSRRGDLVHLGREVWQIELLAPRTQRNGALHRVFELPDVSWPRIGHEGAHRIL